MSEPAATVPLTDAAVLEHPNAQLIARAYRAFQAGDIPAVVRAFDEDITWHVPGRSPLSGDYRGHAGVLDFFTRCQRRSNGTLRVAVDQLLAADNHVIALTTVSAQRNGRHWSSPEIHLWHVSGGKAIAFREFQGDQQTEDEFWSC
jgi:ketosteroid isomerase-like protein